MVSEIPNGRYGRNEVKAAPKVAEDPAEKALRDQQRLEHARMINPRLRASGVSGAPLDTREGKD